MTDALTDVMGWRDMPTAELSILVARGMALVKWPSGRQTIEEYAGTSVLSRLELACAWDAAALRVMKEEALRDVLEQFRERARTRGVWVRQRHGRQKARRFEALTWVKPADIDHVQIELDRTSRGKA